MLYLLLYRDGHRPYQTFHLFQFMQLDWLGSANFINIIIECNKKNHPGLGWLYGQVYISIECIHSAEIKVNNETF